MPTSLADKILVAVDVLLLGAVAAAGVAGEQLRLPAGQDVMAFGAPEPPAVPTPPILPETPPETPAPESPAVVQPETPLRPGQAEWNLVYAAKERGLVAMNRAQDCKPTDFDGKRRNYDEAEKAFQEALAASRAWRACEGVDTSMVDQQEQEIRAYLVGVHKSRPMGK